MVCAHPLRGKGYDFDVPLLDGDHVTDEDGTGFVHTAPGHGRDDFEIWMANQAKLIARGIDTTIPFTVDADGVFTREAPGFEGKRVLKENGDKGDANDAVIKALMEANALIARGRLKHQYPHSWRSKKPVIFRNTPQWFIAMDRPIASAPSAAGVPSPLRGGWREAPGGGTAADATVVTPTPNPSPQGGGEPGGDSIEGHTLRQLALRAIAETQWVPASGQNRITGMIEAKPDWVLSRQRAWGVPIPIFVKDNADGSYEVLKDERVNQRIYAALEAKGISAWHEPGAAERFLGNDYSAAEWKKVDDICDVWFNSASTHAFTLEDPKHFPQLAGIVRKRDGGRDTVMYLEGSDQHRGWFHSSLLESCGTRGRAPYDVVLTHGFVLDEKGQKMSKSLKNVVAPQDVIKGSGADILRLWVAASDYADDLRIGPEILKTFIETYRKIRNTVRWMLGTLAHHEGRQKVAVTTMPELEQLMLHRLTEIDEIVRRAYTEYDYKRVVAVLSHFMNTDLSAFYFDIRKDALYCEPLSSTKRRAALETIEQIFRCTTLWLAPLLCFTAEEVWQARYPSEDGSVHLETFPALPRAWRNEALAADWEQIKRVRRVVTGALEIERANKKIGSSLEAAPQVYVKDDELLSALEGVDFAEVCITSGIEVIDGEAPEGAFTLPDVADVGRGAAAGLRHQVRALLALHGRCGQRCRLSRPVGPRCRGGARVRRKGKGGTVNWALSWLWGPLSPLGVGVAVLTLVIDQAHKWWMLAVYRIEEKGRVAVTPFLDLVYVKNLGVSYGLFLQEGRWGQWLLAAFACLAALAMAVWLARGVIERLVAVSLGLIMGGAIGNAIDRLVLGGVADFFSLHAYGFYWYVFNIADAAIVAGVGGLLYDSLSPSSQSCLKVAVSPWRETIRGIEPDALAPVPDADLGCRGRDGGRRPERVQRGRRRRPQRQDFRLDGCQQSGHGFAQARAQDGG